MSDIDSLLGSLVPSEIWAPIKYGLLKLFIASIPILNSQPVYSIPSMCHSIILPEQRTQFVTKIVKLIFTPPCHLVFTSENSKFVRSLFRNFKFNLFRLWFVFCVLLCGQVVCDARFKCQSESDCGSFKLWLSNLRQAKHLRSSLAFQWVVEHLKFNNLKPYRF